MTASARTLVMVVALAAAAVATVAAPRPVAAQEDEEEVLVGEARRAIARRDYGRAGTLLDQALAANPRRLDVYVLRATVHGVRGEHAEAVALMRRAQKLAPDSDDVLATLGIQLVLADQADEGAPLLEALVAHAPGRYDAQVVLGHYYVRRGRWDDAVTAFAAYFDHRPASAAGEDALHRVDQANAHLRSGDPRRALALYRQVLAAAPDNVLARLGVAWSMAAIDCRQALAIFDDLADLEARYAEVSLVRGRCAMRMGRLDDALTAAQRYRDARPDAGDGWALIGDVAVAKHKLAAAEKAYTRAAEAEPDDRLYAFKLARIERLRDQPAKAAARLRAAGAPPEYEDDWALELGEALYATAAWDDLAAHIGPWAGAHPERATGQFLLGVAIAGRGDVDGAVAPLELAV
ncbi:MAG: tetratricopeptide repeat protein, partial [Myxococcales bacterium]|nr:tetratricopeptide repeat protein [Myxococcales bacterium]